MLSNQTDITPFGSGVAATILDALGFGGGYSQDATWSASADPSVSCNALDLPLTCDASTRTLLLPGAIQGFLSVHANLSGGTTILVAPDERTLAYDVSVAAVGMALVALTGAPSVGAVRLDVATLALELAPEAAATVTALVHGDASGAFNELVALGKTAALEIVADAAAWVGVTIALHFVPGALEVALSIAAVQAIAVLGNLDVALLTGTTGTDVSTDYQAPAAAATLSLTPAPTPTPTASEGPVVAGCNPAKFGPDPIGPLTLLSQGHNALGDEVANFRIRWGFSGAQTGPPGYGLTIGADPETETVSGEFVEQGPDPVPARVGTHTQDIQAIYRFPGKKLTTNCVLVCITFSKVGGLANAPVDECRRFVMTLRWK